LAQIDTTQLGHTLYLATRLQAASRLALDAASALAAGKQDAADAALLKAGEEIGRLIFRKGENVGLPHGS
jgi:hypothetical protein